MVNCQRCFDGYFFYEDSKGKVTCKRVEDMTSNTYYDEEDHKYKDCHSTCKTCRIGMIGTNHYCDTCADGHYWLSDDPNKNCYDITPGDDYYLFINTLWKKCHDNCATCNIGPSGSKTNCLTCIPGKTFPLAHDPTQCEPDVPPGSFYNPSTGKIVTCYYRCEECQKGGNNIRMNCNSCLFQYIPDPDIAGNCIDVKCDSYWYKPSPTTKECLNECNDYIVSSTKECLKQCSDNGLYGYQGECEYFCPDGTYSPLNEMYCLSDSIIRGENGYTSDIPYDQLPSFVDDHYKELVNIKEPIVGKDYLLEILPAGEKPKIPGANIPAVDMTECMKLLNEANNLTNTDMLQMIKIAGGNNNFKPDFAVYDASGKKLDLAPCTNSIIIVVTYPGSLPPEAVNLILTLADEYGVDLTDARDEFFNDICFPFAQGNSDVPLIDRRKDFYVPPTFCDAGCYDGVFNLETKMVECNCAPIDVIPEPSVFESSVPLSNLKIITCFAHWIVWDKLKYSIGFWFGLVSILVHLLFFGIFYRSGLKPLHAYINEIRLKKPMKGKKVNNNDSNNDNASSKKSKDEMKDDVDHEENKTINPSQNKVVISIDRQEHFQTEVVPYSLALRTDNRRLHQFFLETNMTQHNFLQLFLQRTPYDIYSLKFATYFTAINLDFTLNAMFYTDNIISEKYENNGIVSFFSEYLKCIYSLLGGMVIMGIIGWLLKIEEKMELLCLEMMDRELFNTKINKELKIVTIKLYTFFILTTLLSFFYWHYMCTFCIIYQQNQYDWFNGGWISFVIALVTSTFMCFFVSFLLYYSLFYKSRNAYVTAMYLRNRLG